VSLLLARLPSGGGLTAETTGEGVFKVDAIARHRGARIVARRVLPSGRVLLTLRKD
jgi:hypothetical protein